MADENEESKKKSHRERHSGRKAEKKKGKKNVENQELTDKQRNPKAFAFNSAVRAERRFRRKQDINTKKQHVPLVDRTPLEPPPILIAVVGPPKVGKTTLINNLIRLFTRSPLSDIKGPVTIVIGKRRRVTFVECNNDINSMIDLAKVADLVLLLCDASFGFEMEVFEFLNVCQVHGMPRVMGVLTHLDMIKNAKTLKTTKKTLKHRFWTEVYPGAKLFYLSGILHGEYLRNEIKNLGRFISVMKFRPLTWRTTHSYFLADRFEDLTNQEVVRRDPKCDRNVSLYGYVRGIPLNKNNSVHIAGFADLKIHDVAYLPDPCPLPEQMKKRALIEKEKLIYAPFSGVGGIVYDKDAVYVELGGSHSHGRRDPTDEGAGIVGGLIDARETLDAKMRRSELRLFSDGEALTADDLDTGPSMAETEEMYERRGEKEVDELDEELGALRQTVVVDDGDGRVRRKVVFEDEYVTLKENKDGDVHDKVSRALKELDERRTVEDEVSDEDDDDESEEDSEGEEAGGDSATKWKENLARRAEDAFLERQKSTQNLMKLVYGVFNVKSSEESKDVNEDDEHEEEEDEIGGLFKVVSQEQHKLKMEKDRMDSVESSLFSPWNDEIRDWSAPENKPLIENCFVTGKWRESEDAAELLKLDSRDDLSDDGSEMFGDFEDLETGEKHTSAEKPPAKRKEPDDERKALAEKKRRLKEKFDSEYDGGPKADEYYDDLKSSADRQAELNKTVFDGMPDELRVQIEGYRPGMYVRVEFRDVPCEFVANFDPTYPIVVGGLNMGEENIGYVNVKIKKHRWYKKILKAGDPLIVSLGWRRFQTLPLFSKLEDDLKCRYLKYTPQHLTCNAHFWGPITPQLTGFLALQSCEQNPELMKRQGFRIAATGAVQELDKSTRIMKKLKLIGTPMKIYKKTAFIKGMFNSALEVARFEGARIKTVSGIRGQIKKAASKPEGVFRATFEDKIQLSDIVFCRTWYKVDVQQFYNPVTTLLLPPEQKNLWRGVRTTGEVKREKNIRNQPAVDSLYTEVVREPKVFKPLVVPRKLQQALPYRDKPKHGVKHSEKKKPVERVAVVREPYEQKVTKMMKMIKTTFDHKQEQLKQQTQERLEKHRRVVEAEEARKARRLRQQKKVVFRKKSKAQVREEKRKTK